MSDRITTALQLASLAAVLFLLLSCNGTGQVTNPLSNPLESIAGEWTVDQIGGLDVASMLPAGARLPSLAIGADGSVNGFGGVNRLTSALNLDSLAQGAFSLSPVASTRMAGPPAAMEVESKFVQALERTTGFRLDGNALSLQRDEETLLQMRRGSGN